MQTVLLAGGTGFIGGHLQRHLRNAGYRVRVLSRTPEGPDQYKWDIKEQTIDPEALKDVDYIINLCGAGIGDKRWSEKRKEVLTSSRIEPTLFLFSLAERMPGLKKYVSASGITCYGLEDKGTIFKEADAYGPDFTSQLVRKWEEAASKFESVCPVTMIRTAIVISEDAATFQKLKKPVKFGVGSPIGSGEQWFQVIHIDDICGVYLHALQSDLKGPVNACAAVVRNKTFMKELALMMHKPFWFPNVPAFALRLLFGEMADILLKGVKTSNERLLESGYRLKHPDLPAILEASLPSE